MQFVTVWTLWTYVSTIVTWAYDDLSSSKPTNQYRSSESCSHCYADYAVDRSISTCMRTGDIGFTSSGKITWWYVDLGGLKSVGNIRIQFKDYGDEYTLRQMGRFAGFSLYVSNTTDRQRGYLCYKDGPELPPLDFNTSCITHGRYVIFYNERLSGTQYPVGYSTTGVITELCEVTVTGCSKGVYGESCNKTCPDNCMEHECNVINGTCLECLPGWVGDVCDKDVLSANKPASQYRTATNCYVCDANNAVDGDITTCMRTDDIGSTSQMKTTWWSVDLGDIHRIYNVRLQFKDYGDVFSLRQRGRFAGFSLFVSNTTDKENGYLCYKNGPELPTLNFKINCAVHGRHVIFYNERLDGITYPVGYVTETVVTEICEVIVTGCSRHNIKENKCDMPCPDNCQEDRCNILNGTCEDCSPGFIGHYCNKSCENEMHGINCKDRCSGHCLNNVTCNFITGFCNNGCSIGYLGDMCNETCNVGHYGIHCTQSCSPNCHYGVCRHYDGACTCKPGWSGSPYCNKTITETNGYSINDNKSSYIAGLSFLVILSISLVVAFLVFLRRYNKLVTEMHSLQYATITTTPPQQDNNSNDEQHYQELSAAEIAYHNLSLRN